jgi:GT2 family glycosyltransferase
MNVSSVEDPRRLVGVSQLAEHGCTLAAPEAAPAATGCEHPQLSVVIASVNGADYLDACLAGLAQQRGNVCSEIVVADCCGSQTRELVERKYPHVRLLSFAERLSVPRLRAVGIAAARGHVVLLTEDHCIPASDWFERVAASRGCSYAAVGGAVENAATERLIDWAVYLCEYSRYVNPVPTGLADDIPGNNVAYSREAIAQLQDLLAAGRWEYFLHGRLRQAGLELYSDPSVVVYHKKSFTTREFLEQRFYYGRSFAGMRVEGAPWWRRGLFAAGSLGLPPLLIERIGARLFSRRRHRLIFLRALPLLSLFTLSWTVGEFVGYVSGPGDSLARVE